MDPTKDPDLTSAKKAFLEFLRQKETDSGVDFDSFCRGQPEFETAMRDFYRAWNEIGVTLDIHETATMHRIEEIDLSELPDTEGYREPIPDQPSEDSDEIVGSRRPRYEVKHVIDQGGMGTVFKVRDTNLRRSLAMKRINRFDPESGSERVSDVDARVLSRFYEEAQITGQLHHPGIVPVHELGIDNEQRAYFTMQLVKGRNFAEIIDLLADGREHWTQTRALGVILKICEAMAYAHAKGVLHRDLKPANVMVGRFGETYVVDWGLARVLGRDNTSDIRPDGSKGASLSMMQTGRKDLKGSNFDSPLMTLDGDVVGTPSYMSPEQAGGVVGDLGPRSDVYAVGAILYHVLVGHPPYLPPTAALSNYTILQMLLAGPPARIQDLNPSANDELVDICDKAMARNPEDRYAHMMAMAADIEAFLDRRPISSRKPSLRYVLRLAIERNKPVVITIAAALVVVGGLIALYIINVGSERDRANTERDNATIARAATERQLDFRGATVQISEAEKLYPSTPARLRDIERWLEETDRRLRRIDEYRADLATVAESDQSESSSVLRHGVEDLNELQRLRPTIAERAETARTLDRVSITSEKRAWDETIAAVGSSPLYDALKLVPQLGLVPLGANADGFWEFWHVLSGERPLPDAELVVRLSPESGMVLVLLPGGACTTGSPPDEKAHFPNEARRSHHIEPFFISKYEVTQAQWQQIAGQNPSRFPPGLYSLSTTAGTKDDIPVTILHPVESIDWFNASKWAARIDLRLPNEVEWEYACRAGKSTMFTWGNTERDLEGNENVFDKSHSILAPNRSGANWDDGFPYHAPVGSFRANPFGLYDMHGNVEEWCSDLGSNPTFGETNSGFRTLRGGSFFSPLYIDRSACRRSDNPRGLNSSRGVRFARDVRR